MVMSDGSELKYTVDEEGFTHLYNDSTHVLTLSIVDCINLIDILEIAKDTAEQKYNEELENG